MNLNYINWQFLITKHCIVQKVVNYVQLRYNNYKDYLEKVITMKDFDFYEELDFLEKLKVGIGETSEITGIPQRQLRYWEEKGIISSLTNEKGNVRRYNYTTIKKILLIKEFLDEGYSLEGATNKVQKRLENLENIFNQIKNNGEISSD